MHIKRIATALLTLSVWLGSYTAGHFIHHAHQTQSALRREAAKVHDRDRVIERQNQVIRELRSTIISNNTVTPGPVQLIYAASATSPTTTTTTRPRSVPPVPQPPAPPAPSPAPAIGVICAFLGMSCPI